VSRYESRSGRRVTDLDWYTALAFWKTAPFMEGSTGVEELAEMGLAALG
jgi:hypothetical protein